MTQAHIITPQSITIYNAGKPRTFDRSQIDDELMHAVVDALDNDDYDTAIDLLDPSERVKGFFASTGAVTVSNGVVLFNGQIIDNYATRRAIEFVRQGLPVQPLLRFIDKVQQNPSYRAVNELYAFLEAGELPLTCEGNFVAYKKVKRNRNGELVDLFTRCFTNEPGTTVEMPRNEVDEDPTQTCSRGLHVCSHSYLPHFGCGRDSAIVSVSVDPADVVAVPKDYNNSKMRVCRYVVLNVLEEYDPHEEGNYFEGQPLIYDEDEDEDEYEDEDEDEDEDALVW